MVINHVKKALKEGKPQFGTSYGILRSPDVARILRAAGFHWAFIDTEHGDYGIETVYDVCRVSNEVGLCPVVRVADLQYSLVARALDCGGMGIIFPRVESVELLEKAVSWTKFPPEGIRGFGLTPLHVDFEPVSIAQIAEHKNENTLVVLQIETQRAVEMRDELLSVKGIDAVMVGPVDLSISLGVPGEFQHPKMIDAMEKIRDSCLAHGVAPGTQTRNAALSRFWRDNGMLFIGCGSEVAFLLEGAKAVFNHLSA